MDYLGDDRDGEGHDHDVTLGRVNRGAVVRQGHGDVVAGTRSGGTRNDARERTRADASSDLRQLFIRGESTVSGDERGRSQHDQDLTSRRA